MIANVWQISEADKAWFDPTTNFSFLAARHNPGGPGLGVTDANTHIFMQNIPTTTNGYLVAIGRISEPLSLALL